MMDNQDITALDSLEATAISVQQNASVLRPQSPRRTISQPLNDTIETTKNGPNDNMPESMTQNVRITPISTCIHYLICDDELCLASKSSSDNKQECYANRDQRSYQL